MSDLISVEVARDIAGKWHGGMWTKLYAFCSTGTVLDGAVEEVERVIRAYHSLLDTPQAEIDKLVSLRDYLSNEVDALEDPKHGKDESDTCEWCGAKWAIAGGGVITTRERTTRIMDHEKTCRFILYQGSKEA